MDTLKKKRGSSVNLDIHHLPVSKVFCSGVLANGMSMGFSAIAIPDIKQEIMFKENSTSLFDPIETSIEELHWFGKAFCFDTYTWVNFSKCFIIIAIDVFK